MLEGSLLKSNYLGKDGFIWWIGQIAPKDVWRNEQSNPDAGPNKSAQSASEDDTGGSWAWRCKVRIIGYHTFDRNVLADNDLPWAHIMSPATAGTAQGSVFETHRIVGGETAFGFFMDGEDGQQPVIVGLINRPESAKNFPKDDLKDKLRPFTGLDGALRQGATQVRQQNDAKEKEGAASTQTQDTQDTQEGGGPKNVGNSAAIPPLNNATREPSKPGADQAVRDDLASQQFADEADVTIVRENGCTDNLIGKISKILNEFIAYVGRIQEWIGAYIDPVLNTFVDIVQEIRGFARRIVGVVKFIINNLRGTVIKIITNLFQNFIAMVLPLPQHAPVAEATKNIVNIIFCLFEKLIPLMINHIINLLTNMIGRVINAPMCAVEQWVSGILGKLMDFIDDLLGPVMSGLDWLLGGLSQITGLLSKASSIAQQILSFIGCDQLKCEASTEWKSNAGARKKSRDNWKKSVENLNFMRGVNSDIDQALAGSSLYQYVATAPSAFRDCSDRVNQPKTQNDKTPVPNGMVSDICIPPEVEIFGDGIRGEALPIVGKNGSILSVVILNEGKGYSVPPSATVIDNTGHGKGAQLATRIRDGKITEIFVKTGGVGYCPGNYSTISTSPTYLVEADKYTAFEGEKVKFTITTENLKEGHKLSYVLNGDIEPGDVNIIENRKKGKKTTDLTGEVIINKRGIGKQTIQISQDSIDEPVETMYFDLYDGTEYVARTTIIIANRLSPVLPPGPVNPVESPPGTPYPFPTPGGGTGTGVTFGEPRDPNPTSGIITSLPFGGGDGTIGGGGTTGFANTSISGIVTSVIVESPGFGYTSGDTVRVGGCTFGISITPDGSIVGVASVVCAEQFEELPTAEIITQTGQGAELYPVVRFTPKFNKVTITNQDGVISVIDCV